MALALNTPPVDEDPHFSSMRMPDEGQAGRE